MKVCVCGSRSITDKDYVWQILDKTLDNLPVDELLCGGAKGVDTLAAMWAKEKGIPVRYFYPKWKLYGKEAGKIRNKQMVSEADYVVAIWDGWSTGTAHAVIAAHKMDKAVDVFVNPVSGYTPWTELGRVDAICVPTNGFYTTTRNGKPKAVMGRGVAYQLRVFMPDAEYRLGQLLSEHGNHVSLIGKIGKTHIVAFPVKGTSERYPCPVLKHAKNTFRKGQIVPGFLLKANLSIIERSANELAELVKEKGWETVLLPKPGCGAGELEWNEVASVLTESNLAVHPVADIVHIMDKNGPVKVSEMLALKRSNAKLKKSASTHGRLGP